MNTPVPFLAAALAAAVALPAAGAIVADRETPNLPSPADADDPAIWVHPTEPSGSLVIAAVKNGGVRVYDLFANEVQVVPPFSVSTGSSRINNIDVQYEFRMPDGSRIDLAVGSDRGQDVFRFWRIDGNSPNPLTYIGAPAPARAFPDTPSSPTNPLGNQHTLYGLTLYRDLAQDRLFAFGTQRAEARLAQYQVLAASDGTLSAQYLRDWRFPTLTVNGQTFDLTGKQFEGLAVDQQRGILYAGQEDVGIWRIDIATGTADVAPFVLSTDYDATSPMTPDIEGLTIYYGREGSGYLLVSSQGDSTFAIFDRQLLTYLGSFSVSTGAASDAVEHSDGADVLGLALPGYPFGLFITQDGSNDPEGDTNFKYVPWQAIATERDLSIDTLGYDPRTQSEVPEPGTWMVLLSGLALFRLRAAGRGRGVC